MSYTVETQTQTQPQQMHRHQQQMQQYNAYPAEEYQSAEQLYQQQAYPAQHQQRHMPLPQSHAAGLTPGNKVLAERYKTKVCKNFIDLGMCPYESRCMFAHGDEELRTAEMNLHDGIVTEEAIRHFKRMQVYKQQAQQAALDATHIHYGHHAAPVGSMSQGPPSYEVSSFASTHYRTAKHSSATFSDDASLSQMGRKSSSHCMSFTSTGDQYCYDPYGWTPYHNATNPNCECADCLYAAEIEFSSGNHQQEQQEQKEVEVEEEELVLEESVEVNIHDVAPLPQKGASSTAQVDVAGHSLRRPMMP